MGKNKLKDKKVSGNKVRLRTIVILIVLIVILILTGKWIISFFNNGIKTGSNVVENQVTTKDITKKQQQNFEINNINIVGENGLTKVTAIIKNTDKKKYKSVNINVIFYDSNKKQVALAKGLVENIDSNEQKSFSSYITGDYTKGLNYEIKIEEVQN